MAELALNGGNVTGLIYQVPAHGVHGVMWSVVLCPGQLSNFIPNLIDYPHVQPTVSMGYRGCRKKQGRRSPFLKICRPLLLHIILYGRQALI